MASPPRQAMLDAIDAHSEGFAAAATAAGLAADVPSCPGWTVADLVEHLTEVHWFWRTIVAERLAAPPPEDRRPRPAPAAGKLAEFRTGAAALTRDLAAADPAAAVWTWAPQRDVAFVLRHQVQEAAVHHWDAAQAGGLAWRMDATLAADAVAEFLTFSVSSDADPADPPRPALGGRFELRCTDTADTWMVADGAAPGTLATHPMGEPGAGGLAAPAEQLLLWLYRRVPTPPGDVDPRLLERFAALTFTV